MSAPELPMHEAVSAFKRRLVIEALAASGGNRSRAALALRIERTSLLRLIRELGLAAALPDGPRGRPRSRRRRAAPDDGTITSVS
jgi:DNA-binding NtrC family response regulator